MEAVHGEPGGGAQDALIPIWLTSPCTSSPTCRQGCHDDSKIPAPSLTSVDTVCHLGLAVVARCTRCAAVVVCSSSWFVHGRRDGRAAAAAWNGSRHPCSLSRFLLFRKEVWGCCSNTLKIPHLEEILQY
jgi:hypothetical protein